MKHLCCLTRPCIPKEGTSLLEKQALTDMIQQNVSQILVALNVLASLKPSDS
jgi:hypothetical protein